MTFRLVQKLVTLNNLEWRNGQTTVKIWRFFIFQDGSRRHLGFSNFENFNVGTLNMAKLRQYAKFCPNRSNRVRYMVIFRFLRRHVGFSNFRKF